MSVLVAGVTLVPLPVNAETWGADGGFGGGQVVVDVSGGNETVTALAFQPDGKLLVSGIVDAGTDAADAMVLRFGPAGGLDPTFGTGGQVRLAYGGRDSAGPLAVQGDGKILVAIQDGAPGCVNWPPDCTSLVRLNADGQLDPTFLGTRALSRWPSKPYSIEVLSDGRIVAVGATVSRVRLAVFFAARLLADGRDDPSFGTETGFAYVDFGGNRTDAAFAGKVLADGKLLLAGTSEGTHALARLTADGLADPSFGTDGLALVGGNGVKTTAVAFQPDGRIVLGGWTDQGATLSRALANGSPDPSFGTGGTVGRSLSDPKGTVLRPTAMALDASGRILVAGGNSIDRFLPNGALDRQFSATFAAPEGAAHDLTAAATGGDGRLVVAGTRSQVMNNNQYDVLLVRPVDAEAIGYLDGAVSRGGGVVSVWGWAFDRDAPGLVQVKLYADGALNQTVAATAPRPDVGLAFPGVGNDQGFQVDLALGGGNHAVCAEVVNQGNGANRWLGCHTAIVTRNPFGALQSAGRAPGGVLVSGWAIDPDVAGVVSVQMFVDGALVQTVPASHYRPEVGTSAPGSGNNHGFSSVVPVARGSHQVCAYALNQGPGTSQVVGCRNVTVTVDPIGSLDVALTMGGHVGVGVMGWAIDPDVAGPVTVFVTSDGAYVGSVVANLDRPDVEKAVPNYGPGHGFNTFLPGPPAGLHNVCAFAINQGAGTHSLLGCKQG